MFVTANIFQPLIDVFESILKEIHSVIGGSWGWSIVLLTILVRALLVPLTVKQFHSMQALQRLQPELKAIQNKYKDDKQRQQQELMKFYKENNVNPLGSCLPMVLQLPVFISLFYMLRESLRLDICPQVQTQALQHAHAIGAHPPLPGSPGHYVACGPNNGAQFLFIPDLTNHATGAALVVLLVLYVGTQLGSSLMMQSPTMDKTQRQIMLFMPLLFVFIVIGFPAGVLVYWITTNTWTIAQQYVVKRQIGHMPAAAPAMGVVAGGTGGGGGSGARGGAAAAPKVDGKSDGKTDAKAPASAAASGGGIGALLRGRGKAEEPASVGGREPRTTAPPPPPRKKKKRSGRRR
jgi:YidC/Oxa1 family membrane protein insertase